jgi:peptidoglycan/LPS O-acetylase OafA/YrhL
MRIVKPFYGFMVVMEVLWKVGRLSQYLTSCVAALTYAWTLEACGHFIVHTWSLNIEESVYVFCPLVF